MFQPQMAYDWAAMLMQLLDHGMRPAEIYAGALTDKMLYAYRRGAQPLHWRGERILEFWCRTFGKARGDAPVCEVVRGHRVERRLVPGPRVQSLPQWPPAAPPSVPGRGKRKKAAQVA